ncbi:MAG TPA: sulfatase, partial [bacterium]|nr:sulfatase [bacterium]
MVMIVGAVSGWWLQQKKGCVSVSPPPVVPPTVILLSIDTVRADHVGCYGYPRNTTPTIDRLAQESVRYRQVMSVAPNTAPAHMSMLTGMSPLVHGVHIYGKDGNYRTLAAEIPTLAELLHQHGYHTVGLTNSLQVGKVLGFARGFDRYEDDFFSVDGMYRDPVATEQNSRQRWREVLAEANQRRQPLFAFLHHFLNHSVYLAPPREYRERFADQLLDFLPRSHVELPNRPGVLDDDRRFFETVTGEDMRQRGHVAALYDGALAYSDHTVQIMIEELRAAGRWENTLFILVSDHGEELYEHKCWGHSQLWAEHLKVPLLVKFPAGHAAGRVIEQPVQTDALAPTILAVLGMPIPPTMQAAPLPPLQVTSPAP